MGKFDALFKSFWRGHRKLDPIGARYLETKIKYDTKLIRAGLRLAEKNTGGKLQEWTRGLRKESDRVIDDPVRGIGRGAATAAALFGGAAALGSAGGAAGGGTAAGGAAGTGAGAGAAGGSAGAVGGVGAVGGSAGASAGGAAAGGSSGGGGAAASSGSSASIAKYMRLGGSLSNLSPRHSAEDQDITYADEDPQTVLPTQFDSSALLLGGSFAASSRRVKTGTTQADEAVRRGLAGENPIDENGVLIARIQDLSKRIIGIQRRAQALSTQRGK